MKTNAVLKDYLHPCLIGIVTEYLGCEHCHYITTNPVHRKVHEKLCHKNPIQSGTYNGLFANFVVAYGLHTGVCECEAVDMYEDDRERLCACFHNIIIGVCPKCVDILDDYWSDFNW